MRVPQIDEYIDLANSIARTYAVPAPLLVRIADVESAWNPWAARYEPAFGNLYFPPGLQIQTTKITEQELQRTSWGLCQVMGATARRMGWVGPLPALCEPATNLDIAARYLAQLAHQAGDGKRWRWAITAYNHSERWKEINQAWWSEGYTAKFLDILKDLGEA